MTGGLINQVGGFPNTNPGGRFGLKAAMHRDLPFGLLQGLGCWLLHRSSWLRHPKSKHFVAKPKTNQDQVNRDCWSSLNSNSIQEVNLLNNQIKPQNFVYLIEPHHHETFN